MAPLTPVEAMKLAIAEGERGAGFVSPNPLVGCVIVDSQGRLLASGYHARLGGDHAEIDALKKIADPERLKGAHVFVTLEPCAHQGRTPSCAKALAQLPIAKVTYGLEDPNPLVSGRGASILRAAGKSVELFSGLTEPLEELAEIFLTNQRESRPFVAVKVASSLDGRVALPDGTSQWITGEESRAHVHFLRGCYDAVVTGVGTILRDDPQLDARAPEFAGRPNRLVILDPDGESLKRLSELKISRVRNPNDIFFVTKKGAATDGTGIRRIEAPVRDGEFDLREVLQLLKKENIHSLFVEAGGATVSRFLRAKLVDRLYLFLAPKILGQGLSWTEGLETSTLDEAIVSGALNTRTFGEDVLISTRLRS